MNIYVDESGDLGWKFDQPYQKGGSSRYLTITCLLVPKNLSQLPKRIVKDFYSKRKRSPRHELKGSDLTEIEKEDFANKIVELFTENPEIKILSMTVNKENVQEHIRQDPNKLYNYMINLILLDNIKDKPKINFIPDKRTIKVKSGNSLVDYLQIQLWLVLNVQTTIQNYPQESHTCWNLQFTDWVSHIIWNMFENQRFKAFNILKNKVICKTLFF